MLVNICHFFPDVMKHRSSLPILINCVPVLFREPVVSAKQIMPSNVTCSTSHALAGSERVRMISRGKRLGWATHDVLKRALYHANGRREVSPIAIPYLKSVLEAWMTSDAPEVTAAHLPALHVPRLNNPPDYVALANRLWVLMSDPEQRDMSIPHNGYLKLFAMSGAELRNPMTGAPYDLILVDEAQVRRVLHCHGDAVNCMKVHRARPH